MQHQRSPTANNDWYDTPVINGSTTSDVSIEMSSIPTSRPLSANSPAPGANAAGVSSPSAAAVSQGTSFPSLMAFLSSDTGGSLQATLAKSAAQNILASAQQQVHSGMFSFGFLKPYFQVEEQDVIQRLVSSVFPPAKPMQAVLANPDFYVPLVSLAALVITLVTTASSNTSASALGEATILGTAFITVLVYWILSSCVFYFVDKFVLSQVC